MRVYGKPGDPQDADNVLVRCGLVQLGDDTAHISGRRGDKSNEATETGEFYLFLNREPMIQYALSEAIFDTVRVSGLAIDQHFAMLEEHIWKEHAAYGDSNLNGVETLGWLLLRAMSKDNALHNLLTGAGNDPELAEYVNETTFVWCDAPNGFPRSYPPWIEKFEKEHCVDFTKFLLDKYNVDGRAKRHLEGCVEDMWFHVARLDHSDTEKAYFLPRVAVMPPQDIGADIVASWRHNSDPNKEPLLVLLACTERTADGKLREDANNTFPGRMGSRFDSSTGELKRSRYSDLSGPLQDRRRRCLRILLHPNVTPGGNVDIDNLANLYGLSVDVVRQGHGQDSEGNFVALINRTALQRAIDARDGRSNRFGNMVLRLWRRYFDDERRSMYT